MPIRQIEKDSFNAIAMDWQLLAVVVLDWFGMLVQTHATGLLFTMFLANKMINNLQSVNYNCTFWKSWK